MRRSIYIRLGEDPAGPLSAPVLRRFEVGRALSDTFDVVFGVKDGVGRGVDWAGARCVPVVTKADHRRCLAGADFYYTLGVSPSEYIDVVRSGARIILDTYCPRPFETLEASPHVSVPVLDAEHARDVYWAGVSLAASDYVVCNTAQQLDFWTGYLIACGCVDAATSRADPRLERRLGLVPQGISPSVVLSTPSRDKLGPIRKACGWGPEAILGLWSSKILAWQDPATLMRAFEEVCCTHPQFKLVFLGVGELPGVDDNDVDGDGFRAQEAVRAADEVGLTDENVVFIQERVAHSDLWRYYADCDFAVGAYPDSLETHYCLATRFLDYVATGLPFVTSGLGAQADLVAKSGGGICVAPGNASALAEAMISMGAQEVRDGFRRNLLQSLKEFEWSKLVAPIRDYCAAAPMSRNRTTPLVRCISSLAGVSIRELRYRIAGRVRT